MGIPLLWPTREAKDTYVVKGTVGTQGPGNPDTLLLEHQAVQEKYILQTLSAFVGKVNL